MYRLFGRVLTVTLGIMLCFGVLSAGAEDRGAFEQALREDRLALAPVELPGLPKDAQLLSLSPDGAKLLMLSPDRTNLLTLSPDDKLSVYSLEDGTLLDLVLNPGKSNQELRLIEKQFAAPETGGISWSADGRYLAFAFPKRVFMNSIYTSNIWLADLATGAVDPLFELPELIRMRDEDIPDVPCRARFDDREPWLYYELMISEDHYRSMRYYRWNYLTDETVYLGEVPITLTTADPVMLRAGDFLVTTAVSQRRADGAGMASMPLRTEGSVLSDYIRQWISGLAYGKGAAFSLVKEPFLSVYLYGARLLGVRESGAPEGTSECLLLCNPYFSSDDPTDFLTAHMHLLEGSLNSKGRARYGAFLAADVTAPPASRLMRVPPAATKEGAEAETAYQRLLDGEIAPFHNAAYAPDGGYLLLAARFAGMPGQRLYAVNRATGECGLVTQPEDLAGETLAFTYETPINRFSAGITWAAGDLLLVNTGTVNRLYQLSYEY